MKAIIEDGYTRRSLLRGKPGMYPDIWFTWRGCLVRQRAKYLGALSQTKTREAAEVMAGEILAKHIVEWDIEKPISHDVVMSLHPDLFNRLYAIIVKMEQAPDDDEDKSYAVAELPAATAGVSLEEYLEKN